MRKQNTINPEQRPRPGWKPDQGFYHPEPKPIYRPEPKPKRDKNGNIIVKLDNGSYVVIDPQGNASPYKPPKLPVFPEGIFKPQFKPKRPGYLPSSPFHKPKVIRFGKNMSKRAIPTQRTENTTNKYGI